MDRPEQMLAKWRNWLRQIERETFQLHLNRRFWRELVDIVRSNGAIPEPGHIMGWFASLYSTTQAIGIRRQAERSNQSLTFARLLKQVHDHPHVMTRSEYLRYYDGADPFEQELANEEFDEFSGVGHDTLAAHLVQADLRQLDESTKPIMSYVDKRIAHLDARTVDEVPTYNDLDRALDELERVLKKYALLLRGEGLVGADPVPQYNWKDALTVPWIPPDADRDDV